MRAGRFYICEKCGWLTGYHDDAGRFRELRCSCHEPKTTIIQETHRVCNHCLDLIRQEEQRRERLGRNIDPSYLV